MRSLRLSAIALAGLAAQTLSAHAITQFTYEGGAFFELPFHNERWIQVDDVNHLCWAMHNDFGNQQEPEGARLYDSKREQVFFLSVTGGYYWAKPGSANWQLIANGATAGGTQWQRTVHGANGDVQARLGWLGAGVAFVNDPREGEASKYWYQVGPGVSCHVFTEASRSYGPADVQTVNLASGVEGIPAWTLTTGRATLGSIEQKGNWSVK